MTTNDHKWQPNNNRMTSEWQSMTIKFVWLFSPARWQSGMTANYMMLTGRHPAMPKSSYTDCIPIYSAYLPASCDDQTSLHPSHISIQCLPASIQWWPDHHTLMTCRYTALTSHGPLMSRSSYIDFMPAYNIYQSVIHDDQIILHRLPIGIQGLPAIIFW